MGEAMQAMLAEMDGQSGKALVKARRDKFLTMGAKGLAA